MRADPAAAREVVVFRIGSLGDTLVSMPAFWAIRAQFPRARLTLLNNAAGAGKDVVAARILPRAGLFDEHLAYPPGRPTWALLAALRAKRADALVYLAPSMRTRAQAWRDAIFFKAAGARELLGLGMSAVFLSRCGRFPSEADKLLARLADAGISVPAPRTGRLDLALTPDERAAATAWLAANAGGARGKTLVAFAPASKIELKQWPVERFGAVARALVAERDAWPLVFVGPGEEHVAGALVAAAGRGTAVDVALPMRIVAALMEHTRLCVANDTGLMHLAAAAGVPCVAVFANHMPFGEWRPNGPGHLVFRKEIAGQTDGKTCLLAITPDEVLAGVRPALPKGIIEP